MLYKEWEDAVKSKNSVSIEPSTENDHRSDKLQWNMSSDK